MLSKKQNLLETIRGGNPDRYVNQYEAFQMQIAIPLDIKHPPFPQPGQTIKDSCGITFTWQEGTPEQFPVHNDEALVIKDITNKYYKYNYIIMAKILMREITIFTK